MMTEITSNGVSYTYDIVSSQGASFILYPRPEHSDADVAVAKREIRNSRDVVSMRVASDEDLDYLYKDAYFRDPRCRDLRWFEIEQDEKVIRRERKKGTSPADFVTHFVLPFTEINKTKAIETFGPSIV